MDRSAHFADGASEHYRNDIPRLASSLPGVRHVQRSDAPVAVTSAHEYLGVTNDKHGDAWTGARREVVTPSETISTTQSVVGAGHVDRYGARLREGAKSPVDFRHPGAVESDQDTGDPRLLRHGGELWHVDGLHRVGAARDKGRAFRARVVDLDDKPAMRSPDDIHGHLLDDHFHDNKAVDESSDMSPNEMHSYHDGLHRDGASDHRHD